MRPSTVRKKLVELIDGIGSLIDENDKSLNPEVAEHLIKAAENLQTVVPELLRAIDILEGQAKHRSRVNRVSMRVFKAYDFSCCVCGYRDPTGATISRCRVKTVPEEDSDYLVFCSEHKKELNKQIPWQNRGDGSITLAVINKMIKKYNETLDNPT